MLYSIEPIDSFFFRTPAPFEAGGESFASSGMFPPSPSAYGGVFRSFIEKNGAVGTRFRISFNGLCLNKQCYFPKPLDLYLSNKEPDGNCFFKTMKLKRNWLSNYPLDYIPYISEKRTEKEKNHGNYYLSESGLLDYLQGSRGSLSGIDVNSEYMKIEKKIGIAIDPVNGVSKKEQIYQAVSVRPAKDKDLRLAVECDYRVEKDSALVKLGGEGRLAKISPLSNELFIESPSANDKYFKLYFATPAVFQNGWLPAWINEESRIGYFKYRKREIEVKLVSACVGKKVLCGGFGFDKGQQRYQPKELRYAVPAGSVYYFELLHGNFEDAVKLFHMRCISDYRESMGFNYRIFNRSRYCDRGFGYTLVGKWDREQEEI